MSSPHQAVLQVFCPDRTGIVATVSSFMHDRGCNITQVDQSVDSENDAFRMRMVVEPVSSDFELKSFETELATLAAEQDISWALYFLEKKSRVAILCTREPYCLHDLLQRHESGELDCTIPVVISNHDSLAPVAGFFNIPFVHVPVEKDDKPGSEARLRATLGEHDVDLLVLARYMQVLSPDFVADWTNSIINIHHSLLPAFVGAAPYRQAHERGVHLIGATAHYVTAKLDGGPIIAQDVIGCSHRDSVADLVRKGRDVERTTLAEAVRWHLERRLLVQDDRVIVFG
jgi:formyltetrahydrofolate deformylase